MSACCFSVKFDSRTKFAKVSTPRMSSSGISFSLFVLFEDFDSMLIFDGIACCYAMFFFQIFINFYKF